MSRGGSTASAKLDDEDASSRALFVALGPIGAGSVRLRPTDYTRGPWDHGLLHGGPIGGLAVWAAERLIDTDSKLLCSRLTLELLSAVPLAELDVAAEVVKPGRRSTVVDVRIDHGDRTVARASTQWVMPSPGWTIASVPGPTRPVESADPGAGDFDYPRPGFNCDAAELRPVTGSTESSGPGTIWARLTSPLVAGLPTSDAVRLATLADLGAAAGWETDPSGMESYINPDLTMQVQRYPTGEWIAIEAANQRTAGAIGFNDAVLYDDDGAFGRILQSLVPSPIQMPLPQAATQEARR